MFIQILTLRMENKTSRIMIEEHSNNIYAVQIDTKRNKDNFYNGFQYITMPNGSIIQFNTAKEALSHVLNNIFKKESITNIDNEVSCLLKEEEIKLISNLTKINNI